VEAITLVPEAADGKSVALIVGAAADIGAERAQEAKPSTTTTRHRRPPITARAKVVEMTIGAAGATI